MAIAPTQELRDHVVDRFAGLSTRGSPLGHTRIESHDLLNVELSKRVLTKRLGSVRQHTAPMRDASARLDGIGDYLKIPHVAAYQPSNRLFVSIDLVLWKFPESEVTILSKGFGTGSDRFFQLSYDPTISSGNGGWRLRVWDATAAALRNVALVSDGGGDDAEAPIGHYRHIELAWAQAGDLYRFQVYNASGSNVDNDVLTIGSFATNGDPWTVGVSTTDGTTLGTDFAHVSVAELRIGDAATLPAASLVISRELDEDPAGGSDETTGLVGYWKMNDGRGSTCADAIGGNEAVIGGEGPAWVTDPSVVLGTSALRFYGAEGYIHVDAGSLPFYLFNGTSHGGFRRWTVAGLFVPRMDAGESTVRNQTILWCGSGGTGVAPHPLGIVVESNVLKLYYRDNSNNTITATSTITLHTHVGKRIRWFARYDDFSGGETIKLTVAVEGGVVGETISASVTAPGDPGNVSPHWFIGQNVTNDTQPHVPIGGSAYGILDDFWAIRNTTQQNGGAPSFQTPWYFSETESPFAGPDEELVFRMRLNDGSGQNLRTEGSIQTFAYLFPEEGDGVLWDQGLVKPYRAPEVTLLDDYARITTDGTTQRVLVAISGCTLYECIPEDGTLTPIAAGLHKGGPWTAAQRDGDLYLAAANGYRPRRIRTAESSRQSLLGSYVDYVGIRAPVFIPKATASTSGGSLADGDYWLYVTYYNPETGDESNPSPGTEVTISGGGGSGRVDSVVIPISADPQVTQRRIYMTALNGVDGDTAYLVATVQDNLTATWTEDITAVDLTQPTLEYVANMEAPPGATLAFFRDRLWVGGPSGPRRIASNAARTSFVQTSPTFAWYSEAGTPTRFHPANFLETSRDQGDPITAFEPTLQAMQVHLRDTRSVIQETNIASDPFQIYPLDVEQAAQGPHGILTIGGVQYFLGEHDILASQGQGDVSISNPRDASLPAIPEVIRERMNESRRGRAVLAHYQQRDQLWLTYSSDGQTRHDRVLVYNLDQGTWSLYGMELDFVTPFEDASDEAGLYGAANGFIVRLDEGFVDERPAGAFDVDDHVGVVAVGTTTSLQDLDPGLSWTVNRYQGCRVYWLDASSLRVLSARIRRNTSDTLFFDSVVSAPASSSLYWIGGIPWWAEFLVQSGTALQKMRLGWLRVAGTWSPHSEGETEPRLRVTVRTDDLGDAVGWDTAAHFLDLRSPGEPFTKMRLGGIGRSFRLRFSDHHDGADETTQDVVPSFDGQVEVHQWSAERTRVGGGH